MIKLDYISLLDIVPENLKQDEQIKAASLALDAELKNVSSAIKLCLLLPRLDELSEEILDLLAWQYHVDFYDSINLTIEKKRNLIWKSIEWHRKKGTPWAVEQVVQAAITPAKVEEWFDYGGDPHHFKIKASGYLAGEKDYRDLISAINSVKRKSQWLDSVDIDREVDINAESGSGICIGFLQSLSGSHAIRPKPPEIDQQNTIYAGMAKSITGRGAIHLKNVPDQSFLQTLGVGLSKGGWLQIKHEASDLPILEHLEAGLNFCVGSALSAVGVRKIKLPEVSAMVTRTTFGIARSITGKQEIRPTMAQKEQYSFLAGIATCKSGSLTIKIKGE